MGIYFGDRFGILEAGTGTTFFVATNGNDAWMGKLVEPNAVKTDGAFCHAGAP
jgi:hypothetical protein